MNDSKSTKKLKKKASGRRIRICFILIFTIGFFFSAYKCLDIINTNEKAINAYETLSEEVKEKWQKSKDFNEIQKINSEIIAWISATDIGIDYPVMYTDNNEYYLTHLYDGSSNVNGAIFVDCENLNPFNDKNTVIYGHTMLNGTMFNPLNDYKSQEFYDEHPTLYLYTPEGDYLVELISGTVEDGDYKFVQYNFTDDDAFLDYINRLMLRSTFKSRVQIDKDDMIVSLCTCTHSTKANSRYMVVGKLTKLYE